jgi:tRNA A37 threonylcarbamoyladenosine dehydratase
METKADIFLRSETLLGTQNMDKLTRTRVIIFGVGG